MERRVLYAGDTSLATAAGYLAGLLTRAGIAFDYVPSDEPIAAERLHAGHALYIVSDYPVNGWGPGAMEAVVQRVRAGAGLLMIGGWESFHGAAGEYPDTPLAEALPVEMADADDRVNCSQPCLVEPAREHPITAGLPWERPPCIGGYNRFTPRPDGAVILRARHVEVGRHGHPGRGGPETGPATGMGETLMPRTAETCAPKPAGRRSTAVPRPAYTFAPGDAAPLLVLGRHGAGRTAALATDVAPHWVGPLVDWGDARVRAQADGADAIEVGSHYAELVTRLVRWTLGQEPVARSQ